MKFAPIISRLFRSHCRTVGRTVGPNFRDNLSGDLKLPPIIRPKSDMADYRRLPPIIIFPRRKFSHCPIFHPIFHPTLLSVRQWDADLTYNLGYCIFSPSSFYLWKKNPANKFAPYLGESLGGTDGRWFLGAVLLQRPRHVTILWYQLKQFRVGHIRCLL